MFENFSFSLVKMWKGKHTRNRKKEALYCLLRRLFWLFWIRSSLICYLMSGRSWMDMIRRPRWTQLNLRINNSIFWPTFSPVFCLPLLNLLLLSFLLLPSKWKQNPKWQRLIIIISHTNVRVLLPNIPSHFRTGFLLQFSPTKKKKQTP